MIRKILFVSVSLFLMLGIVASISACTPAAPTAPAAPAKAIEGPAPDLVEVTFNRLTFPNPDNLATMASDSLLIDQAAHRLYVADYRGKYLNVFDISKPTASFVQLIKLSGPPMVIAVASEMKRLYTANNDGTVSVIDVDPASKTKNTEIAVITTPPKAALDGAGYIPGLKKVYITDTRQGILYVIDANTNKIIKTVDKLGANLEPAYYNSRDKMAYMGVESDDTFLKFDPKTDTQVGKYQSGTGSQPTHIAFSTKKDIAVLGSANAKAHVITTWDLSAGKALGWTDKTGAIDAIVYSPKKDMFIGLASSYRPDPTQFKQFPMVSIFNGNGQFLANVPAPPGGRGDFDETNGLVYMVDTTKPVMDLVSFTIPDLSKKAPTALAAAPAKAPVAATPPPATTTPSAGGKISWEQALKPEYKDKAVTVTGPVVEVQQAFGTKVNVYLGGKSVARGETQKGFIFMIQDPSTLAIKDIATITKTWMDKTVEVTGTIILDERNGTIQINVTKDDQVKIATEGAAAPSAGGVISWDQAIKTDLKGKSITVTGPVVEITQAFGTKVNVYLGKKAVPDGTPQEGFCILVSDPSTLSVKDFATINKNWMGKTLEVKGEVQVDERHGTVQITVTKDDQIVVK